jgi:hypothetical protein
MTLVTVGICRFDIITSALNNENKLFWYWKANELSLVDKGGKIMRIVENINF